MSKWVKIDSWHIVEFVSRGNMAKTKCGKWAHEGAEEADQLDLSEKSCETCLRIAIDEQQTDEG